MQGVKSGERGGREEGEPGIDLQFHGSHNLHLIISCSPSLSLPLSGDDLAGESFNQLLTGPRGCQASVARAAAAAAAHRHPENVPNS